MAWNGMERRRERERDHFLHSSRFLLFILCIFYEFYRPRPTFPFILFPPTIPGDLIKNEAGNMNV